MVSIKELKEAKSKLSRLDNPHAKAAIEAIKFTIKHIENANVKLNLEENDESV